MQHDLDWIKQQLATALELECSTLPLYLAALYSLEIQSNTAYTAIRVVVMEEMVHMAIAANVLAALGGSPQIASLAPAYPLTGLAGGVEPDLRIGLAQLSKAQLENFMRLEMPEFLLAQLGRGEEYPTVASFYRSIRQAISANAAAVDAALAAASPSNQVNDDIGFHPISNAPGANPRAQVLAGLERIVAQGEGASARSMFAGAGSEDESSHYNRFAELYYGANFSYPEPPLELTKRSEAQFYGGRPIPFPAVVNTLAVPADGYARMLALDPNAVAVEADLTAFDQTYTAILTALQAVWTGPATDSWKTLGGSVHGMVNLRVLSCFNILRHQIPPDVVARIPALYGTEAAWLQTYSNFAAPLFYGPRFLNLTAQEAQAKQSK
jgi:Ferritin-like